MKISSQIVQSDSWKHMFKNDITIFEWVSKFLKKQNKNKQTTIRFEKHVYASNIFVYHKTLLSVWYLSDMFYDGFKKGMIGLMA
jgi:hypothetical protein